MKALTIWQPWASLIACGAKQYETRSWATQYRGPIAIHAAAKDPNKLPGAAKEELERAVRELFNAEKYKSSPWRWLPTGAVIATAELVSVWRIAYNVKMDVEEARKYPIIGERMAEDKHETVSYDYFVPSKKEAALGDWTPGRYAWKLANVKILQSPIPVKGKQGLWNFEMPGDGGVGT